MLDRVVPDTNSYNNFLPSIFQAPFREKRKFSKKERNSRDFELLSFPNLTIEIAKIASYKLLASWICEQNSENSFEAKHDEAFVSRKNIRYPVVG